MPLFRVGEHAAFRLTEYLIAVSRHEVIEPVAHRPRNDFDDSRDTPNTADDAGEEEKSISLGEQYFVWLTIIEHSIDSVESLSDQCRAGLDLPARSLCNKRTEDDQASLSSKGIAQHDCKDRDTVIKDDAFDSGSGTAAPQVSQSERTRFRQALRICSSVNLRAARGLREGDRRAAPARRLLLRESGSAPRRQRHVHG